MGVAVQKYIIPTYSYVCTAYVRSTLRRALELQSTHNVWADSDYVNSAQFMIGLETWERVLPDTQTWDLTRTELVTIRQALAWRRERRNAGQCDHSAKESLAFEWGRIEAEVNQVLRGIWHSEGKYWM